MRFPINTKRFRNENTRRGMAAMSFMMKRVVLLGTNFEPALEKAQGCTKIRTDRVDSAALARPCSCKTEEAAFMTGQPPLGDLGLILVQTRP